MTKTWNSRRGWHRITIWLLLTLVAATAHAQALNPDATAAPDFSSHARATAFLDALDAGRWQDAHGMLAEAAAQALPPPKLQEVWQGLDKQLGQRTGRSAPRSEHLDAVEVTTFRLDFPAMVLDARVHFDAAGKIDGFRIVPAAAAAPTPAAAPAADSGLSEDDRKVAGLSARLTWPDGKGPFSAVVLVHGSGPNDMDGSIGPNKPLRNIAHGLAARGIAVLRYHKRTRERPQDFTATSTLDDEVVNDALAAVALLKGESRVDSKRIFVAGHSLGGQLAPRIAARDASVAGIILLAAPSRPVHHMVPAQVRYIAGLDGTIDENEAKSIAELEQQRDAIETMLAGGAEPGTPMLGASATYWRDLGSYDPIAAAEHIDRPMLVLQGGRDYQVTTADDFAAWERFAEGRSNVTTQLLPALDHLLIRGEGASTPQQYMVPGDVDDTAIDAIAAWIGAD